MKKYSVSALMVATSFLFNSCATNPVTGKRDISFISEEQEIAMGKEADPQIVAQFGFYQDPKLQQFIQEKGQKMAAISHRSNLNFEFKVVDSPIINAFAVPGGYIYFTRGIMVHFNNEAQFAGVLGHEIGHVTARHTVQQQSKGVLAQVGLIAGMILSPTIGQLANEASQGLQLLFLKFGRDDERESDRLGVEYATKIGYDAAEMADFFLTLQRKQEESGAQPIPGFLSTHPNPGDRYVTVHELAAEWKLKENLTRAMVNRNEYLRMIDGMIYGEDPKAGFVENNTFYHPELKFQFAVPPTWMHTNSPQQFQMAPQDGKAMMTLTLAQGETLEAAAQQMVQQNNLQVLESNNVQVNGLSALAFVVEPKPQQQQQQQQIRALVYLIKYNNNIYSITGITTQDAFSSYLSTFLTTMRSFRTLSDPDKLNRQPMRIDIKEVPRNMTLAEALRLNNVLQVQMEELAILNGMNLNDMVDKGTFIKIVVK